MTQSLDQSLNGLRKLAAEQKLSPAEKMLVRHIAGALEGLDRRLTALESEERSSASTPIADTPQGETAPLSR